MTCTVNHLLIERGVKLRAAAHFIMEETMEHTPIPWEIAQLGDGGDGFIGHQIWNRAGGEVCIIRIAVNQHHDAQYADFVARCEANAAFIVRAVNNHAKLLSALEHLDAHIPDREGLQPVDAEVRAFLNHKSLWRAKELAREAIKEARK